MEIHEREQEVYKFIKDIEVNKQYTLGELDAEFDNLFSKYPISPEEWEEDFQNHWGTYTQYEAYNNRGLSEYEIGSINTIESYASMYCDYGDIYLDITFEKINDYTIKLLKIN